ncbi:MAG: hypothetical protein H0Z28_11680 [Archaeoglobus sp.]|nr:hypothetical protein [Archaeoglobus sp.]
MYDYSGVWKIAAGEDISDPKKQEKGNKQPQKDSKSKSDKSFMPDLSAFNSNRLRDQITREQANKNTPGNALLAGIMTGTMFGAGANRAREQYKGNEGLVTLGEIGGSIGPWTGAYKLAAPITKGITSKLGRMAATGAIAGAGGGATKATLEGKPPADIAKEAAIYGGLGAAIDPALEGVLIPAARKVGTDFVNTSKRLPTLNRLQPPKKWEPTPDDWRTTRSGMLMEPETIKAPTVPKPKLTPDKQTRSFPLNLMQSDIAKPELKGELHNQIQKGAGKYTPVSNKDTWAQANELVNKDVDKAVSFVINENEPSALHTATGIKLIDKFQKEGNYERAIDVSMALAEKLTKQGQAIQAASIVGRLSPESILLSAQRQINKINRERMFPGLTKEITLTPTDAQNLKRLAEIVQNSTGEAKIEASQELQAALNALRPAGIGRKLSTTQTVAQLLNPKTHVRNILGNELFYRLERVNKYVATPIDWARSKLTGSKRVVTFATAGQGGYWRGFLKGAKAGWRGVNPAGLQTQFDLGHGLAFNPKGNFAEKTMSYLEKVLGAMLRGFDYAAYTRAKNQTIGELATLRAINTTGRADKKLIRKYMQEMETNLLDIADQYGKYVTFQDNNVLSNTLQRVKHNLNMGKDFGLGDLIIKYPRTPGALVMRGLEYSPAGFLRSAYILAQPILKGKPADSRESLLALSRAITGTLGLTGLGYYLADVGIITGQAHKDKDLRALQRQVGEGAYRVNKSALVRWVKSGFNHKAAIPRKGDVLITYDWAQPVAMALSFGANINKNIKERQGAFNNTAATLAGSVGGTLETIAEQPVLQGLQRAFQGYSLVDNLGRTVSDLPASFTPTLLNQIRQYVDNTARLTYDPNPFKQSLNRVKYRLPGISSTLPVRYDTFGNKQEVYQDGGNSLFNVFLNPSFVSKYKVTPEAKLAIEVFKQTGETKHIPRVPSKYIMIDGQRVDLTPQEYSQLQRIVGNVTREGFRRINPNSAPEHQIQQMVKVLNIAGKRGRAFIKNRRALKPAAK